MTKSRVLEIFALTGEFMSPGEVCKRLREYRHLSSVYSYLHRLHKQGLLFREEIYGRIAYRISPRGIERLKFFNRSESEPENKRRQFALVLAVKKARTHLQVRPGVL